MFAALLPLVLLLYLNIRTAQSLFRMGRNEQALAAVAGNTANATGCLRAAAEAFAAARGSPSSNPTVVITNGEEIQRSNNNGALECKDVASGAMVKSSSAEQGACVVIHEADEEDTEAPQWRLDKDSTATISPSEDEHNDEAATSLDGEVLRLMPVAANMSRTTRSDCANVSVGAVATNCADGAGSRRMLRVGMMKKGLSLDSSFAFSGQQRQLQQQQRRR